jgi:hypothetical protein
MTLANIIPDRIVGERKCYETNKWVEENFRKALRAYCDFFTRLGGVKETQDLVKQLVPIIAAAVDLKIGPAVGFCFWALGAGLNSWCGKNATREFDGEGNYIAYYGSGSDSDFPDAYQPATITGIFNLTYIPPVFETIKDNKYPLPVHKIEIYARAEINGFFAPSSNIDLDDIVQRFSTRDGHEFEFNDVRAKKSIKGTMITIWIKQRQPEILGFSVSEAGFTGA